MDFNPETLPHYWINRLGFLIRKQLQQEFRQADHPIGAEEWAILLHLWQNDGQSAGRLADLTIRDRPAMSRLLEGLVQKGFVARFPDPDDRRKTSIHLTDKGREMEKKLVPIAQGLIARSLQGVASKDVQVTLKTLRRMAANMQPKGN
jgi:DNA-binding MarR family transcriptional regulator